MVIPISSFTMRTFVKMIIHIINTYISLFFEIMSAVLHIRIKLIIWKHYYIQFIIYNLGYRCNTQFVSTGIHTYMQYFKNILSHWYIKIGYTPQTPPLVWQTQTLLAACKQLMSTTVKVLLPDKKQERDFFFNYIILWKMRAY